MVVAIVHLQQSVYHHDHITQQVLSPVTNQESARTITAEYPLHISSRYHLSCLVSGGFHLTDSTNGNLHGYFKIFFTLAGVTLCNVLCILLGNMRPPVLTHQVQKGSSNTLVKGSGGFMWCLRFFLCDTGIAKRVCCPPSCTIHRAAVQCPRSLRGFRGDVSCL